MAGSVSENCEMGHGEISEFFKGKSVFITGATGFMGKVLVEKLLRCCPGIENIYILIREKKKSDPETRIKKMTALPLFDILKQQCPQNLEKLKPMRGDVSELGLGLCEKDQEILKEKVNIIYHAAASVRFDDSIQFATLMNVRGTLEVVKLALKMKKLEILVHISTTYCNLHEKIVEEKMYPAPADWRQMIKIAEEKDDLTLRILTPKILGGYPNTYTFTKGLAEHVINDHSDKIPSIILRPSILISTSHDPFPGWIDNFNGPVGMLVAAGMGLAHVSYCSPTCVADYMPVDLSINATIIATWKTATESQSKKVSVYQCSNDMLIQVTFKEVVDFGQNSVWEYPLHYCIWYPCGFITQSRIIYFTGVVLFHVVPAILLDSLMKIAGQKPILLKVARRIYIANRALSYFTTNEWRFMNKKTIDLQNELHGSELDTFGYYLSEIKPDTFYYHAVRGARKYLLKRGIETIERERFHMRMMYVLHLIFTASVIALFLWFMKRLW